MPAILNPLPHVAVRVVKAECIWLERTDFHRPLPVATPGAAPISGCAIEIRLFSRNARPGRERRGGACASRVLPFGLGQETIGASSFLLLPGLHGGCQ